MAESERLNLLIAEFLERQERGEQIAPAEFLAAHPRDASNLKSFFEALDIVERTFAPDSRSANDRSARDTDFPPPAETIVFAADPESEPPEAPGWMHKPFDHFARWKNPLDSGILLPADGRAGVHDSTSHRIGRFTLRAKLGAGAFGTVYRAHDPQLDRDVALKIPRCGTLEDADLRTRFFQEARAAARLQHPHIVPVFDAGEDSGQHYIASAYIEGKSLAAWAAGRAVALPDAANVVRKLAGALGYAHREGVIHRDVKPQNVMMDAKGEPHLMDFGLAKLESESSRLTQDGMVIGTPVYIAPEQASGVADWLSPASDQYSLGIVLYELLTGQVPFSGPGRIVLINVLVRPVPPPRLHRPEIPLDLETICLKAVSKDPKDRYESCEELGEDLARWLRNEPIRARRMGRVERFVRWCRREPWIAGLSAAVVATAVTGATVSSALWLDARTNAERADRNAAAAIISEAAAVDRLKKLAIANDALELQRKRAEKQSADLREVLAKLGLREEDLKRKADELAKAAAAALTARKEAEREKRRANANLYVAMMNLLQREWDDGNLRLVKNCLRDMEPKRLGEELRGFEYYFWERRLNGELRNFPGHEGDVRCLAFGKDGRMASAGADKSIHNWNLRSEFSKLFVGHSSGVVALQSSPDLQRFVSADAGDSIKSWNPAGDGDPISNESFGIGNRLCVSFSPDGNKIAVSARFDPVVTIYDGADHTKTTLLKGHEGDVLCIAWSPNSDRIVTGSRDKSVRIWDAHGKLLSTLKPKDMDEVFCVAFSPDGQSIVAGSEDGAVRLWSLRTAPPASATVSAPTAPPPVSPAGAPKLVLKGHAKRVNDVRFSPDGESIVSCSADLTIRTWASKSGQVKLILRGHLHEILRAAFTPDGRRIVGAGADGELKLWEALIGQEPLSIKGDAVSVHNVAVSPDGRWILACGADNSAELYDSRTGRVTATLVGHTGPIQSVAFSPDGRWIATASSDRSVRIWNAETRAAETILAHADGVSDVAFSADSKQLASACLDKSVQIWETDKWNRQRILTGHVQAVRSIAFSHDGTRIAAAAHSGTVRVWNVATGVQDYEVPDLAPLGDVAFSPDGRFLAAVGRHGVVLLVDPATGKELSTIQGHDEEVRCLAFSPDSRRLATGSIEGPIKLWDLETGRETLTLKAHTKSVNAMVFSAAGLRLLSASGDGTIRIWDARPWTDELKTEFDAFSALRFHEIHSNPAAPLARRIADDPWLSEPVRQKALEYLAISPLPAAVHKAEFEKVVKEATAAIKATNSHEQEALLYLHRGEAYQRLGEYRKALTDFSESIKLNGQLAEAWNARAWLKATCPEESIRNGQQALIDATAAIQLTPVPDANFLDTRAAAYAEQGRFQEAVGSQTEAVEAAPEGRKSEFKARLELYQKKEPYREPRLFPPAKSKPHP